MAVYVVHSDVHVGRSNTVLILSLVLNESENTAPVMETFAFVLSVEQGERPIEGSRSVLPLQSIQNRHAAHPESKCHRLGPCLYVVVESSLQ